MTRRRTSWLVALPIVLAGSQVAHGVAYWWAYPEAGLRATVLHESGHGYFVYAPMLLSLAAAVELLALAVTAVDAARRHPARPLPAWLFGALPLLTYVVQEHLERLLSAGAFPWWTSLDPTFWRGVLLQVPIGLVAWLVARLLLRTAAAVGRYLGAAPQRVRTRAPRGPRRPASLLVVLRPAPIAGLAAGRAPPCRGL